MPSQVYCQLVTMVNACCFRPLSTSVAATSLHVPPRKVESRPLVRRPSDTGTTPLTAAELDAHGSAVRRMWGHREHGQGECTCRSLPSGRDACGGGSCESIVLYLGIMSSTRSQA